MQERLLYIGHKYHMKTKSTQFLIEMFKEHYDVSILNIDPYCTTYETELQNSEIKDTDILVLFQMPINGNSIKKYISFKKAVFFPMYDGAPARHDDIWLSYKDFNIINFSKTLHEELKNMGLSSFYIQYFPQPISISSFGKQDCAFFWQRLTCLNINTISKILKHLNVKNVHMHKAIDPSQYFVMPSKNTFNYEYSTWYDKRDDMLKDIEKSAIYIAPRVYEGIGMSFLEAMAMGRCVIAPDNPTMNEYIKDGETGILYKLDKPELYRDYDIKSIQQNTLNYIKEGYSRWKEEKNKIIGYINEPVNINEENLKLWNFYKTEIKKTSILKKIFSISNEYSDGYKYKVITFFGIKIKIKKK